MRPATEEGERRRRRRVHQSRTREDGEEEKRWQANHGFREKKSKIALGGIDTKKRIMIVLEPLFLSIGARARSQSLLRPRTSVRACLRACVLVCARVCVCAAAEAEGVARTIGQAAAAAAATAADLYLYCHQGGRKHLVSASNIYYGNVHTKHDLRSY